MEPKEPTRPPGRREAVAIGIVSGLLAQLPFILLGRMGLTTVAFVGLTIFFAFDPWLTVPVFVAARRGLSVREGALAGVVSGSVAAMVVAGSLILRGRGLEDAPALVVYPVSTAAFGALAAAIGFRFRRSS